MNDYLMDIVIPVWNRPVDTRTALVSLIHHTPGARFILVDNGSDQETEYLLQEFAEGLSDRCLHIRSERNEGAIRAVNRGLALAQAPLAGVVSPTTIVGPGWSEALVSILEAEPDVGVVLPPVTDTTKKGFASSRARGQWQETTDLTLAALLLRRALLADGALVDEGLDGSVWCLKDCARRVHARGFRIGRSSGPAVRHSPEILLGSPLRRQALTDAAREKVLERWGGEAEFCLQADASVTMGPRLAEQLGVILLAARQGHRLTLLLPFRLYDQLAKGGRLPRHESLEIVRLPRLLSNRASGRIRAQLSGAGRHPEQVMMGVGDEALQSFARFASLVAAREKQCYGR